MKFIDNKAAAVDKFIDVSVDTAAVLKSWKLSLFSYEWLDPQGCIKPLSALSEKDQARRKEIEALYEGGQDIEKPVLGLGLQDNIEIGSGKAVFLTLTALGLEAMPVHIPRSNQDDFKKFLS